MLLTITERGIYCEQADVYIDPWKPVNRALITHAHSDHARPGHKRYLAQEFTVPIIEHRLKKAKVQGIAFGEKISINGVNFSFHPAGHIIGSAQIKVEYKGRIEVASGDYKIENDHISGEFEMIPCHHYITESTFGLPVFRWEKQEKVFQEINDWWARNKNNKKLSVLTAYSLGKAQRLIYNVDQSIGKIYVHPSIQSINDLFIAQGIHLPNTIMLDDSIPSSELLGNLLITPSSAIPGDWAGEDKPISVASASGWMALRGMKKWRSGDKGFVLSDHADWEGINLVIKETGASTVTVTHGYTEIMARWFAENGITARTAKTEYASEFPHQIPKED